MNSAQTRVAYATATAGNAATATTAAPGPNRKIVIWSIHASAMGGTGTSFTVTVDPTGGGTDIAVFQVSGPVAGFLSRDIIFPNGLPAANAGLAIDVVLSASTTNVPHLTVTYTTEPA